jgi:NAD(P)H-hydrate epimerase
MGFYTEDGILVPSLTTEQMREVDRIAVEDFGLGILQMMENAGRNLAQFAATYFEQRPVRLAILVGPGGNGGGGLCSARHLHNHGFEVSLILSKSAERLGDAARSQLKILEEAAIHPLRDDQFEHAIAQADVVIDALIGYSLQGAPRGVASDLIEMCNKLANQVISLDIPSGVDSTNGERPGAAVRAESTLTLALPKSGLNEVEGEIYLADIGIPPEAYHQLGIEFETLFDGQYVVPIYSR